MHTSSPHRPSRPLVAALVPVLFAIAQGCADTPRPMEPASQPSHARATEGGAARARSTEATRRRLERAAAGLLYTSESDYPFEYVFFAVDTRAPLTEAAFRAIAGVPADSLVEERTLDDFFARHIERVDPGDSAAVALVPRYESLKRVIRTSVRGVRVYRVGQIAIRCYVVGVDARGNVIGLATKAIET